VASRIPWLLNLYEKNVSLEPTRPTIISGYAKFLDIHYKGVEALPGDEPDGCNPEISPFEIAAQSWITYGLQGDSAKQRYIEGLTVARKPDNVIDAAWKIVALTWMHKDGADALIEQLYRYQKPNGTWPYQFDTAGEPADFISFNVLWALAEAGHRPETEPRMRLTYEYCLQTQRPEGGWQGLPTYKGFNTPFRDTQFAVLALSKLFPGDHAKAAQPPEKFSTEPGKFLEEADLVWGKIDAAQSSQLRQVLKHNKQVLVRDASARALGRAADTAAIPELTAALGDDSKLVQRAAAQALREIAIRRQAGSAAIAASLASKDARTRWGALRIFNQHFRDITGNDKILAAIVRDLNDPAPQNRFQSAWALSRWYSWQNNNPAQRQQILTALTGRLGSDGPQMTNARRGLVEAIYTLLDENTGYLQAWIKASAKPEDHDRIEAGYETVAAEQAKIIAKALRTGNASERDGLMLALWDFHVRHMTVPDSKSLFINLPATFTAYTAGVPDLHRPGYEYPPYRETANWVYDVRSPFQQVRIGNDSELIHFFHSSGPELEQALVGVLTNAPDAATRINALKAGSTLAEAGGPLWAASALTLAFDPDQEVRDTLRYVYEQGGRGILNFQGGAVDPKLRATLLEILTKKNPEGLAVVLPMIARFEPDSAWAADSELAATVRAMLASSKPGDAHYPAMIEALAAFPSMLGDSELHQALTASLNATDQAAQRSAMLVIIKTLLRNPNDNRFGTLLTGLTPTSQGILVDELNSRRYFTLYASRPAAAQGEDSRHYVNTGYSDDGLLRRSEIRDAVIAMLHSTDTQRRAAALDLAGQRKILADSPDVRHEIALLRTDSDPRIQRLASSLLAGKDLAQAFRPEELAQLLDYQFFVAKVEPILARTGGDGKACVICHNSHAIFKLQPPAQDGKFADTASHDNFTYALRVVNIARPESSLILIKPTRPSDAAGDVNTYESTHNGGQRWPGNEASPEYQTILAWIRGAHLNTNVASK
jgi:HEAT repeat protein